MTIQTGASRSRQRSRSEARCADFANRCRSTGREREPGLIGDWDVEIEPEDLLFGSSESRLVNQAGTAETTVSLPRVHQDQEIREAIASLLEPTPKPFV